MMRLWSAMHRMFSRHDAETLAKVMDEVESAGIEQRQLRRLARSEAMDKLFQAVLDKPAQGDSRP